MVMTLFHGLICGVVALYTTRGLRSPCLMMAVRKRQNIVQWSYRRVPLNVVPRIPLLGYPDIDQRYLDWSPSLRHEGRDSAATADRHLVRECPFLTMVPVMAVSDLVAGR
jgi:hypothetical protein